MTKYLKPAEAAEYLHVQMSTLALWRMKDCGPDYIKVNNRKVLYDRDDLDVYLAANKHVTNRLTTGDIANV